MIYMQAYKVRKKLTIFAWGISNIQNQIRFFKKKHLGAHGG